MKSALFSVVLSLFAAAPCGALADINVAVPGTSNPWLAPSGSTDGSGDSTPANSPRLANGLGLYAGEVLTFTVTGSVDYNGNTPVDPPDGELSYPVNHPAQNGVGGINAPVDALIGVFIDTTARADPTNANVPASLDFFDPTNVSGGVDYPSLAPALNQPFFIGDGRTSAGATQTIIVPDRAGALYFGTMDGAGWYNNTGQLQVAVSTGAPATSLTATFFQVNGYAVATAPITPGSAITFTASQGASASSGVYVRVQTSTDPDTESTWTDLPDTTNGGAGFLAGDGSGHYALTSSQYPAVSGLWFRAISAAPLQTDSISNRVGPFDLSAVTAPNVDLEIGQNASTAAASNASVAYAGDQITYTYAVRNHGPDTARGVKVVNVLPANLRFVSADNEGVVTGNPDDGVSGGGTVTWPIGDLAPNPTSPIICKLVVAVTKGAVINSVITNNDYGVLATGVETVVGHDLNATTVKGPVDVVITSNAKTASPGDLLTYTITVTNNTTNKQKKVAVSIPKPTNGNIESTFSTINGVNTPGVDAGSNDTYALGNLKPNQSVTITVNVRVPYDADPKKPVVLPGPEVDLLAADGTKTPFIYADEVDSLVGPPANPPHFGLVKFIPTGVTTEFLLALSPTLSTAFTALFPGLDTASGIAEIANLVNPNVTDSTDDVGVYRQQVFAPGQSGGPDSTSITYALIVANDGGTNAPNVVLTDRVPPGTKFVKASPSLNGKAFANGAVTVDSDGSTLHFALGTVKAGKPASGTKPAKPSVNLVLYTVQLLKPSKGGPSLGANVEAQGGSISTPVLLATTYAAASEIDTYVAAPGAAYLECDKGTPVAQVNGQMPYDIFYENTGGVTASDFQIVDAIPAGTTFVSADLLDNNHGVRQPDPTKGEQAPAFANGQVTYHLGKVKAAQTKVNAAGAPVFKGGGSGWVRLTVAVQPSALDVDGLLIENDPYVPTAVFPGNPQRDIIGPQTRGASPLAPANTASAQSLGRIVIDPVYAASAGVPEVPRLGVGIQIPASVKAGDSFDCLIWAANPSNTDIGKTELSIPIPDGLMFLSGSDGSGTYNAFQGVENGKPAVIFSIDHSR